MTQNPGTDESTHLDPQTLRSYEADLMRVIQEQVGEGYEDITRDTPLLEYGILDSLMIQSLLAHIEDRYHVLLPPDEVRPEKFGTIAGMARVVLRCSQQEFGDVESNPFEIINAMMESYGLSRRWMEIDGHRHHMLCCDGKGPTLVLLSGLGSPASSWGVLMRSIRTRRRAVALDLVGFGVSTGSLADYSYRGHVDRTLSVLEQLDEGPYVLVGNSAGGMIAAEMIKRQPDLASALVVLSFGRVNDGRLWWQTLEQMSDDVDAFWHRAFRDPPPLSSGLRRQIEKTLASPEYLEFLDEAALGELDQVFAGLDLPAMFIGGMDDRIVDLSIVEAGAQQVPGARFEQISRCGHFSQSERSEEVLVYIEHFLAQALKPS